MTLIKHRRSERRMTLALAGTVIFLLAAMNAQTQAQSPEKAAVSIHATQVPSWQTAAGGHLEFEAASVRLSEPGSSARSNVGLNAGDFLVPTDLFSANVTLINYITFAYKLSPDHEQQKALYDSLPKWAMTEKFAVQARASGSPTRDQYRLMMQSLLADRFKFAYHIEQRDVPVFGLRLAKPARKGSSLRPHMEGPPCNLPASEDGSVPSPESAAPASGDESFPFMCGRFNLLPKPNNTVLTGSRDVTMDALATWVSGLGAADLKRHVVDRTGLVGRFDFALRWNFVPPNSAPTDEFLGVTFEQALKDQLGMELIPAIAPLDFFLVDHIEMLSQN